MVCLLLLWYPLTVQFSCAPLDFSLAVPHRKKSQRPSCIEYIPFMSALGLRLFTWVRGFCFLCTNKMNALFSSSPHPLFTRTRILEEYVISIFALRYWTGYYQKGKNRNLPAPWQNFIRLNFQNFWYVHISHNIC